MFFYYWEVCYVFLKDITTCLHVLTFTDRVALATTRDATVAFGAAYGALMAPSWCPHDALMVPVERRITQYLREKRLCIVGCDNFKSPRRVVLYHKVNSDPK